MSEEKLLEQAIEKENLRDKRAKKKFKFKVKDKVFEDVFDTQTMNTIYRLASNGTIDSLEHVISPGKEAVVFKALDLNGKPLAVKIYKIKTSDFHRMTDYLEGDRRFKYEKRNKQSIVFAWAKKEFKNLQLGIKVNARVPFPKKQLDNVLVMEFIGGKEAAPTLFKSSLTAKDLESVYTQTIELVAKMIKAKLIHADLSEYNLLWFEKQLVLIDVGQAVLLSHPKAKEFFERDIRNLSNYFSKHGLKKDFETIYNDVKKKKEELK
ncbi:MAG: serine protein kinase RIO [archaeon]